MRKPTSHIHNKGNFLYENRDGVLSKSSGIGLARLRQIEKLIGFSIIINTNEAFEHGLSEGLEIHNQTIRLLKAFELIRDIEVRNDMIALVLAAAQHETQHN